MQTILTGQIILDDLFSQRKTNQEGGRSEYILSCSLQPQQPSDLRYGRIINVSILDPY